MKKQWTVLALVPLAACAGSSGERRAEREWQQFLDGETPASVEPAASATWSVPGAPVAYAAAPRTMRVRPATSAGGAAPDADASVRARLARTRIPRLAVQGGLREAAQLIGSLAGVNVWIDEEAELAVEDEDALVIDRTTPISAKSALDLLVELAGEDVAWTVRHGTVLVTTPEGARGAPRVSIWDVSDLLRPTRSYGAPEINVLPSGSSWQDFSGEEVGMLEGEPLYDEDWLIGVIQDTIAPGTWDDGTNSVTILNGKLIVRHD